MMISVISPCRNEASYIDAFLESLLKQDCTEFDVEIIIADGASDDGTSNKLARWVEFDSRIKVINNPERIVSTGLNRAIKLASGDIIVRMDIHTIYASDYIRQCVSALESTGAKCVGGPWFAEGVTLKQRAIANAFQSRFGSGGAASRRRDYTGPVDTVYLGAWWRSDLEQLGGFDEDMVRNQDDELCLRITRSGGQIWQSSAIRSTYTPRNSLVALARQFHQYGYWKALVLKKHHIPASLRHIAPFAFVCGVVSLAALTPFSYLAAILFALTTGAYVAASLFFAILVGRSTGSIKSVVFTAAAFYAMHFGYGLGFGRGLYNFFLPGNEVSKSMESLTR